ncbi:MAG TPA: response regulator transcription factor [Candidatus Sulfomarinibacteraceae bacterium]|nr:response regulator transcription factor [Candidatus Sulfomarinibacteraceae bacterium]
MSDSKANDVIRVFVADDHKLFREGLIALLQAAAETEVVGEAGSGRQALAQVAELHPDVVLMDIMMPDMNGIEATRRIVAGHDGVYVVMLTMLEDDDSLFAAMCAGARGYILKGADKAEVLRTVTAAARGQALFSPAIAGRLTGFFQSADEQALSVTPFPELTDREREVLELIAQGRSNAQIAAILHIASKTVSNHISNIFNKLQVADRAQAIVKAREAGMGEKNEPS